MKVIDATVDWAEGLSNDPTLQVLVDEIPPLDAMRFERHDGLWYAEHEGYVRYYSWAGPENEGGFSGRHYTVTTIDGAEVTLKGPWSSRAGVMNNAGFGPCVGVRITTDPEVLNNGHTFQSGAISLLTAKQAVDLAEEASHLQRIEKFDGDEPYWVPVRGGASDA